jgi:hypothetical protein
MRDKHPDINIAGTPVKCIGNVSQSQVSPSDVTAPGISSTPSISSISACRSPGRHGAKPMPQLPMTTVVTP